MLHSKKAIESQDPYEQLGASTCADVAEGAMCCGIRFNSHLDAPVVDVQLPPSFRCLQSLVFTIEQGPNLCIEL